MKRLIINADDLGHSIAVSRGIEKSYREGLVTSSTLLANMPGFEEGVRVALENPGLGVGIHLNLIRGEPLTDSSVSHPLLGPGGKFLDSIFAIGRVCPSIQYLQAAEVEYRAQIERCLSAGIKPDHLDFEKHHGIWKPLYTLGCRLAQEYDLGIRTYKEPLTWTWQNLPSVSWRKLWKALHLRCYCTLLMPKPKVFSPDYLLGQCHIGGINRECLRAVLLNLPEGVNELMCHPGMRDEQEERQISSVAGQSWITLGRVGELAALADPEICQLASQEEIELGTYAAFMT